MTTHNDSEHAGRPHADFNLESSIEHIAHWLPTQAPLKDFIHHNTLHAVQDHHFHDGIAIATRIFSAKCYLTVAEYQKKYQQGKISDTAIEWAINHAECQAQDAGHFKETLFAPECEDPSLQINLKNNGIRTQWLKKLEVDLNLQSHPIIFRLLSSFLDQGISQWVSANSHTTFWNWVSGLVKNSLITLYPFEGKQIIKLFDKTRDEAITHCLYQLVGDKKLYEQYLLEMLLAHPGWSGMVRVIEERPYTLLARRKIALRELIAVELICELALLTQKFGARFPTVAKCHIGLNADIDIHQLQPKIPIVKRVWHDAMEYSRYEELFIVLQHRPQQQVQATTPAPFAQALFCLDDRECSIRRLIEEDNTDIETFGAPGFFGIDFMFQGLDDVYPVQQCPPILSPKHLVREIKPAQPKKVKTQLGQILKSHVDAHSLLRGWLHIQVLGLLYSLRLAWLVFKPGGDTPKVRQLSEINVHNQLHLLREGDEVTEDGYLVGFSYSEMADKVENLFRNIGLKNFSRLIVLIAHGSSSVNNPHFAAYDCGACSGKPGVPNARAFAWMANHPTVRGILQERNVIIPEDCHFVPALHNTSRDELSYYDLETLPSHLQKDLELFQLKINLALQKNAKERCRWFELAPETLTNANSAGHVRNRATALFEPRPELNHSNNLYCIVGKRTFTKNLFLDRRSFLHSYNGEADPEGLIASRILSATIPICGGISLEYMFSRFDNSVYGAGTKLPHNVIGLVGVANGVEGDLRTGLPSQMIEVHEPARILYLFEQTHEVMNKAFEKLTSVKEWIDNEWIRIAVCEPVTNDIYLFVNQQWEKIITPNKLVPTATFSEQITIGKNDCIPATLLKEKAA